MGQKADTAILTPPPITGGGPLTEHEMEIVERLARVLRNLTPDQQQKCIRGILSGDFSGTYQELVAEDHDHSPTLEALAGTPRDRQTMIAGLLGVRFPDPSHLPPLSQSNQYKLNAAMSGIPDELRDKLHSRAPLSGAPSSGKWPAPGGTIFIGGDADIASEAQDTAEAEIVAMGRNPVLQKLGESAMHKLKAVWLDGTLIIPDDILRKPRRRCAARSTGHRSAGKSSGRRISGNPCPQRRGRK